MPVQINPEAADIPSGGLGINYTVISTNTTTTLNSSQGTFYGIIVTTGGTGSTVTVYDNTAASGNVIVPSTTATTATGPITTGIPAGLGIIYTTGLTVVTAGTGAATILVLWK